MTRSFRSIATAIFAVTALGGTAIAAQQETAPPPPGVHGHGKHRMLPRTREEATAAADRMFAKLDSDRNGQVTAAEFAAVREARQERREARGKAMGGRGQKMGGKMGERMFARMDIDRSGSVSQAEHRAAALARFQRIDTNGDGRIDDTELQAMRDKRMARRGPSPSPQQSPDGE
jgi:Ca2+-binding EF-hand superfamily protein